MYQKIVALMIGLGLLIVGLLFAGPVVLGLLGALIKEHTLSGWRWEYDGLGKVFFGGFSAIAGFLVLLFCLLKKRSVFWVSLFTFIIVIVSLSSFISYRYVIDTHISSDEFAEINIKQGEEVFVEIPYNSNTAAIANLLSENSIIKSTFIFKVLSKVKGYDGLYQSCVHKLSQGLGYDEVMQILVSKPESVKVMIPEGYTYKQIVDLLVSKKLIDRDEFEKVANTENFDYLFLKDLPPREHRLEGYLFPDTYEFGMNTSEKEIIRKMLDNFNRKFKYPEFYDKAKDIKLTPDQVIILASIVEREAQKHEERRTIAGVFYKRMNSKDKSLRKLQSCATIQYISMYTDGKYLDKILEKDTKVSHPYNTYENEGLPPGPISSPGLDSIEAALYPEDTDYLFFVAKGDGSHQFSRTYSEHQAAMKKYGD
jgi:UPF0755 protein